ncbi:MULTISPECIES: DUF6515 family protein [Klebsiella pneumoniae complex]|uniref:DUF6515 family protein n=1 Tax=Klebsiella pneumoniae complex TaxID=3390273 RepID=UPI0016486570|nr:MULTISPECIES: DUF6515 family protein [Klebsiella]MBC4290148.1 hypothetical protein [Klebsiella quasipneumoniae]MCE0396987.1 hypothetical protein [Klebsiella variicola subsp. variicola]MDL3992276.1 hypothetical protein [Klebsiella variicola]HDK9880138.1 hypothetical protein [Klebsiella pneumoniae]HDK9891467.1 hypothetical protein [Klebsiella pneumoniae]
MKKLLYALLMTTLIVSPSLVLAAPGPGGPGGPGPDPFPHHAPSPRLSVLPDLATALIIGGLTYYVVNGIYYQKQGTEYIRVDTPSGANSGLNVVDYNGKRYYVRNGSYYQRDIDGNYIEVPRPAGL